MVIMAMMMYRHYCFNIVSFHVNVVIRAERVNNTKKTTTVIVKLLLLLLLFFLIANTTVSNDMISLFLL